MIPVPVDPARWNEPKVQSVISRNLAELAHRNISPVAYLKRSVDGEPSFDTVAAITTSAALVEKGSTEQLEALLTAGQIALHLQRFKPSHAILSYVESVANNRLDTVVREGGDKVQAEALRRIFDQAQRNLKSLPGSNVPEITGPTATIASQGSRVLTSPLPLLRLRELPLTPKVVGAIQVPQADPSAAAAGARIAKAERRELEIFQLNYKAMQETFRAAQKQKTHGAVIAEAMKKAAGAKPASELVGSQNAAAQFPFRAAAPVAVAAAEGPRAKSAVSPDGDVATVTGKFRIASCKGSGIKVARPGWYVVAPGDLTGVSLRSTMGTAPNTQLSNEQTSGARM